MVIGKSYVGDWFLIYLMGQNIDSVIFKVSYIKEWLPRHYSLYIDTIDHKIKEIHTPKISENYPPQDLNIRGSL